MKCGDWSACDIDFCKYFVEGEVCIYEKKRETDEEEDQNERL